VVSNGSAAQAYPNRSITTTTTITSSSATLKKNNKKDKNKKLTKADIGLPSDFKHVSHVGWG
jgi:Wiskott-Aldrich syndrome protein